MQRTKLFRISLIAITLALLPMVVHGAGGRLSGYLTFGDNVIVTPEHLQPGDLVILTDQSNLVVFERQVTQQTNFEPLNLPSGLYRLRIERDGQMITETSIPYKM